MFPFLAPSSVCYWWRWINALL